MNLCTWENKYLIFAGINDGIWTYRIDNCLTSMYMYTQRYMYSFFVCI